MILFIVGCVIGLVLLARAADEFVVGAARLAFLWRVPPLVIGAVVVGFGTSAPEMLVSAIASVQGDGDLGIGNVVGSNIANLTLILGIASLLITLAISSDVLRREAPLSAAGALLFGVLVWNGLSTIDGFILLGSLVAFLGWTIRSAAQSRGRDQELTDEVAEFVEHEEGAPRLHHEVIRTLVGLLLTLGGAQLLVWGASGIAEQLGFSEGFVGLTLVAVGTSLPELVTAIAAARRGEDELIIGNLIGSNLFNSLAVGATIAFLGTGQLDDPDIIHRSVIVMGVAVLAALAFMATGREVTRREGVILLVGYVACIPLLAG